MKTGLGLQALAAEIEKRANERRDFIAPVSKLAMVIDPTIPAPSRGEPMLAVANGNRQLFAPNQIAHNQLAEYTGIPAAYYRRCQAEHPQLLASQVNTWLHAKAASDRRMVRTRGTVVDAFVSDKFRALDNMDLAEAALPVLMDLDLLVVSSQVTDTRLYIKAVDKRIERDVPTGRKMGDGSHVFFDTVSPAITISNSEVGHGALAIETGVYTRVCTNLAMIGRSLRKFHTGARAELSDEVYALLTDKTKRLTDAAVWGQVRDLVRAAFSEAQFAATCEKLTDASKEPFKADDAVQVIERTGRKFALGEGERKGILARLIEGGDLTRYGLHAAITRHSADVDDYDRASELERIGGEVIELPRGQWQAIADAA